MFLYMAVFAIGEMIQSPLMPAIVNDLAEPHLRGRYNAAVSWSWAIGNVIGPVVGGTVLGARAHTLWIGLGLAGCAVGALVAQRLEAVLPTAANRPTQGAAIEGPADATGLKVDVSATT
jgi:MFS family permease